jgi:DNA (cytosine-5)-methyltransferase 1
MGEHNHERRARYRATALKAHAAKQRGRDAAPAQLLNVPRFAPEALMPEQTEHGLHCLSLFSGGGGLDIGFERAGFRHVACYEILPGIAACLSMNRPAWTVRAGEAGDVRAETWAKFRSVDVMFGGPPCQPHSQAGEQNGKDDERDMIPSYVRAIQQAKPRAFLLENVATLLNPLFAGHLHAEVVAPLARDYQLRPFTLDAANFGIPQVRRRAFIVGFRAEADAARFVVPIPTHRVSGGVADDADLLSLIGLPGSLPHCMGAREALGLSDIGFDSLAPTLRSGLTSARFTTSIVSGQASAKNWAKLAIWPNGVSRTREAAQMFPSPNGHFRLSVPDCALLQGFPSDWQFPAQAYLALGVIGNSVCPPVAFYLAVAIRDALQD